MYGWSGKRHEFGGENTQYPVRVIGKIVRPANKEEVAAEVEWEAMAAKRRSKI
jgi:hypothetical protein